MILEAQPWNQQMKAEDLGLDHDAALLEQSHQIKNAVYQL